MTRRALLPRFLFLALLAALIIAAVHSTGTTARATCSIGVTDYPRGALREVANAPVLLVGTVATERSIQRPPNTQPAWESVITPEAIIKGQAPHEPLLISYIGFLGADCSGGPRLREGERVLIPVYWGRPSYGGGEEAWQLHGIFSKVLIEDGQATLEWFDGSEPLGEVDDVIRQYGLAVGADETRIQAGIEAAKAPQGGPDSAPQETAGSDNGGPDWTWAIVAALGVTALAGIALGIRRVRGQ